MSLPVEQFHDIWGSLLRQLTLSTYESVMDFQPRSRCSTVKGKASNQESAMLATAASRTLAYIIKVL